MFLLLFVFIHSALSLNKPALIQVTKPVDHGEGPYWDNRTGLLYFVDMFSGGLESYNLTSHSMHSIKLNGDLTVAVPSRSDPHLIIVGLNRAVMALKWDGKNALTAAETLTVVAQDKPTSRLNDGKADKQGRLWFGTMGHEDANGVVDPDQGSLYLITRENLATPEAVITPVNISNGMAWNKANNKFFYIDSSSGKVVEYDYDDESGSISNPRVAFDLTNHPTLTGVPDGMTIDKNDNLWIALYGGGCIVHVNPNTDTLLQVIAIPARYVTSVCWGGHNFDILFVTTSRYLLSAEERLRQPAAGSVFAIKNLKTGGLPAFTADIIG